VLDELTRHAVSAWLAELAETRGASTVGTRLRGMRRSCRWLVAEGELEVAPTDGIEIPAPPEKPVPILTDAEIAALLKTCAVPRGRPGVFARTVFLGRRDEVVLRLLLDTGVRVSELCGLELTDVDLDRELAHVPARAPAPGWCRSAPRPPRPSTATCGCAPCTRTPAPHGCCSTSAVR
jgi:site-specific recombinase XerD